MSVVFSFLGLIGVLKTGVLYRLKARCKGKSENLLKAGSSGKRCLEKSNAHRLLEILKMLWISFWKWDEYTIIRDNIYLPATKSFVYISFFNPHNIPLWYIL